MSFTAKTAFLPRMWNNRNDDLQNIAGKYGTVAGTVFTPADCSAGFICTKGEHLATGGYKMTVASDGTGELYACNPGDVQRGVIGGNLYAEGYKTLGLGAPEGYLATFSHLKVGETYAWNEGNFSTAVTATNKYATFASGLLVGTSAEPASGTGYYLVLDEKLGIDVWTEGMVAGDKRYNMTLKHN